jgi:hypothetical protein
MIQNFIPGRLRRNQIDKNIDQRLEDNRVNNITYRQWMITDYNSQKICNLAAICFSLLLKS